MWRFVNRSLYLSEGGEFEFVSRFVSSRFPLSPFISSFQFAFLPPVLRVSVS